MEKAYVIMADEYGFCVDENHEQVVFRPSTSCIGIATSKDVALELISRNASNYETNRLREFYLPHGYRREEIYNGWRIAFKEGSSIEEPIAVFYCIEYVPDSIYEEAQDGTRNTFGQSRTVIYDKDVYEKEAAH